MMYTTPPIMMFMIMSIMLSFKVSGDRILNCLLILEGMSLILILLITILMAPIQEDFYLMFIIILSMVVCEGTMGLAILITTMQNTSKDMVKALSLIS